MTPTGGTDISDIVTGKENPFKVQSSWFCATENGLENTLVLQKNTENVDDPTSLIGVETCTFLTKETIASQVAEEDSKCSITLQATGNAVICTLSILSEARMVEVHGPCDEYLNTIRAEFVLEVEDTHVYCADVKLEHPANYLSLKLNRLTRRDDVWIYGLVICWKEDSGESTSTIIPSGQQHPFISYEAVDQRLSQLGKDLSINAQQCKQFLEMCSVKSRDERGDGPMTKPPFASFLASMLQGRLQRNPENKQTLDIESLLDQKLCQLEQRILASVDQRIQEMEKRQHTLISDGLEKILQHLQLKSTPNVNMEQTS